MVDLNDATREQIVERVRKMDDQAQLQALVMLVVLLRRHLTPATQALVLLAEAISDVQMERMLGSMSGPERETTEQLLQRLRQVDDLLGAAKRNAN